VKFLPPLSPAAAAATLVLDLGADLGALTTHAPDHCSAVAGASMCRARALAWALAWACAAAASTVAAPSPPPRDFPRPPWRERARLARWLVHSSAYGAVATRSARLGGAPFAATASLSDGGDGNVTGRLLFFLTPLDSVAADAAADPTAALALCEAALPGGCADIDAQDPTCAKVSITGALAPVPAGAAAEEAAALLFARHPAMRAWPPGHGFRPWELRIETVRVLDWYGGAADVAPEEYWAAVPAGGGGAESTFPFLRAST
jgi:hypothetical protein